MERILLFPQKSTAFGPFQPYSLTGRKVTCTNLSSYNYLGFGGVDEYCTPLVRKCLAEIGLSAGASRGSVCGTYAVHKELETKVAAFLKKDDAFVIGMGFATNSTLIPCLIDPNGNGKGCLILSDALNHKSIVEGVRMSAVAVKAFKHNDMVDLERRLRDAIDHGQPGSGQPWRKIVVIVEGIYSMEGDFCRLREIVALKNKYGAYLYLDEAHSIGAVGPSGRGCTELFGVPTHMVDVMMGTFTKSFGSAGGYVAGDKDVIANLRKNSPNASFACSMSPACAAQALAAFTLIIDHKRGKEKIDALRRNSNFFRKGLGELGFWTLGDEDSPVIPMLLDQASMWKLSVEGLAQGLALVVVCAPATPYLLPRARFCVSAAHTIPQLQGVLDKLAKFGERFDILFRKHEPCRTDPAYYKWLREAPLEVRPYPPATRLSFEPLARAPDFHELPPVVPKRASHVNVLDPIGLIQKPPAFLLDMCDKYLQSHGFGTCGPRGFYGTTMEHLDLEKQLAHLFDTEACIFYAQGVSVASSVLASPMLGSKDLVFCFSKCHYGIKSGLRLNGHCSIVFVRDESELGDWLEDWSRVERVDKQKVAYRPEVESEADNSALVSLPERFRKLDRQAVPLAEYQRRYVITEGMFLSDGEVCDMGALVRLKGEYGLLLCVDESLSLGGVGPRGVRDGATGWECGGNKIDIYLGSLEFAVGSIGGFCAGPMHLVRDLRLTSSGYCFSASAPGVSCLWSAEVVSQIAKHHKAIAVPKITDLISDPAGLRSSTASSTTNSTIATDDEEDLSEETTASSGDRALDISAAWSRLLKNRFLALQQNVELLQQQVRDVLSESYNSTGAGYVLHLRPREKAIETEKTGDLDQYRAALKKIVVSVPGLDIYERPAVEKALDARLKISEKMELPTLRLSVTAMHDRAMITDLCGRVAAAGKSVV